MNWWTGVALSLRCGCRRQGNQVPPGVHLVHSGYGVGPLRFSAEQVASGDFNPKMFNSFLDGTKSAIEMAAVANATGLLPQDEGLRFPPVDVDDLATVLRPRAVGGQLTRGGTVEVISSVTGTAAS